MLELKAVKKRFGAVAAVDGVSLTIQPGEMVGVIGRSGAGKSTLLRLINRLVEPDEGAILWQETDVRRLKGRALRQWRAQCAMIFQQYNLSDRLDVVTNVLIGSLSRRPVLPSIIKAFPLAERAQAVLELDRLGMADTALQRAGTLSGGQMQRVAIARALMQKPVLLLADEPVSALDPHNTALVMQALRQINRDLGLTVIVNLHAIELARSFCDRIIGMSAGRVVFDGPPQTLDSEAQAKVFGSPADASH